MVQSLIKIHFVPLVKIFDGMITKTQIKDTLDSLPENVTIEEVIEHLIFLIKSIRDWMIQRMDG